MKKNQLNCYYTIEGIYKVSKGSKLGIYNINEVLTNKHLIVARAKAFKQFGDIVNSILNDNSIEYESEQDAYRKLHIWFLKTILTQNSDSVKQKSKFTAQQQYLSINLIVECRVNIGEPRKEVFSSHKYTIYGIKAGHNILEYCENLFQERGVYNFHRIDISKYDSITSIPADTAILIDYKMLKTDLGLLLAVGV
jgi:hypothetical protein